MKAKDIQVGRYYWVSGKGPMLCTEVPDPAIKKTTVTLQVLPLDPRVAPWENYWADPENVLHEANGADLVEYRINLARAVNAKDLFELLGVVVKVKS